LEEPREIQLGDLDDEDDCEDSFTRMTATDPESNPDVLYELELARARARELQDIVNVNQQIAADKMVKKHDNKRNKRTLQFELHEPVSVLIPRIDRGGTDLRRLPGIVTRITEKGEFYEITSAYGILNDCYRASDLESYHGVLNFDHKTIINKIALSSAASRAGNRDKHIKQIVVTCNCKLTTCKDARCKCFKNNAKCGSHCHAPSSKSVCCNK
jgi:hypothetical protein